MLLQLCACTNTCTSTRHKHTQSTNISSMVPNVFCLISLACVSDARSWSFQYAAWQTAGSSGRKSAWPYFGLTLVNLAFGRKLQSSLVSLAALQPLFLWLAVVPVIQVKNQVSQQLMVMQVPAPSFQTVLLSRLE